MSESMDYDEMRKLADDIRLQLFVKKIKQVDLIPLLNRRGIETSASGISEALNGRCNAAPRYIKILNGIADILEEKGAND